MLLAGEYVWAVGDMASVGLSSLVSGDLLMMDVRDSETDVIVDDTENSQDEYLAILMLGAQFNGVSQWVAVQSTSQTNYTLKFLGGQEHI